MRQILLLAALVFAAGCAGPNVDVTKTAKGFYPATDPNDVDILFTKPDRPFTELGAISSDGWSLSDTAKLHNALRAKAAPLGATSVIVMQTGVVGDGWGHFTRWSSGVAIRFK
jgi:hypothetical protein